MQHTELLETAYPHQVTLYFNVASFVLAVADALQCFPSEVEYIWRARWNMGKVLYLWARYFMIFDFGISFTYSMAPALTPSDCRGLFAALSMLLITGVAAAEGIMYLRLHALAGRGRYFATFLVLLFVSAHSIVYIADAKFIETLRYVPSPFPHIISCLAVQGTNKFFSAVFITMITSELIILSLTLWIWYTQHRDSMSPLMATFYRDGLIYFVLLSAVSAGNIICNLVAKLQYIYLLSIPQRIFHSILATRMVLHLRKVASVETYDTFEEVPFPTIDYSMDPDLEAAQTNADFAIQSAGYPAPVCLTEIVGSGRTT
ncbi:hypothetical protein DFP72DRAFT_180399 [Ephemerocybe angulata]|uniref:DUF6533 domain-containing protein n=1 Tax=Ephemerocybe angulata TaxID=980116 RepID=A0A8H6M7I5_9AGAR|nr:hypothetical protein DFP72DRAFT_180399 [Tulosesus angulatus]